MRILVASVLALLLSLPLLAQTTSVVQDNVGNAEAMYYFHQRNVARSTTGVLMVVWVDKPSSTAGGQVQYSTYDPGFDTWSPPAAVSNAGDRARQPALAADENGNIHCVWMQTDVGGAKYQEYYSKFNGVSWSTPVQVSDTASGRAEEGTIEVASDGTLWVVYNNDGEGAGKEYVYAVKSTDGGTTWSSSADVLSSLGTIGTSIEDARVALASGPDGKMIAVWDNNPLGTATTPRETYANQYDGSSWRGEELVTDTAATAAEGRLGNRYSAAAIDQNANIYIFYNISRASADTLPRQLVVAKKAWNDVWSPTPTAVIDSHPTVGGRAVSAAVDSGGVLHVAFHRDVAADTLYLLDEIVYTWSVDGGMHWASPIVLSREGHDAGYVTISNRVRRAYGIDVAWRESRDVDTDNQDTIAVVYANVPYSVTSTEPPAGPVSFRLWNNFPNPFNPTTAITYELSQRGHISLVVYDALGREVKTLYSGVHDAGTYRAHWDGTDANGTRVASGVYYSRLTSGQGIQTIKMLLIK
jgi:hypothetical protein